LQKCDKTFTTFLQMFYFTCNGLSVTRGRVRAGPSLQLGTLSTRIYTLGAGAPRLACLRMRIILSALSRLSWRAYARRPCYARHTFSGLAALCRMPKTKLIGRPVPEIWPNAERTDRHDLPTNQPTNQPAVLPVPSCKLGIYDDVDRVFKDPDVA